MNGKIWAGLIVARVVALVDSIVDTGAEADEVLRRWPGARVEVAEGVAAACGQFGLRLPRDDAHLRAVLAKYGTPMPRMGWGLVGFTAGGRAAVGIGTGRTIESVGATMALVRLPGDDRYVEQYTLPGVQYLGGSER